MYIRRPKVLRERNGDRPICNVYEGKARCSVYTMDGAPYVMYIRKPKVLREHKGERPICNVY